MRATDLKLGQRVYCRAYAGTYIVTEVQQHQVRLVAAERLDGPSGYMPLSDVSPEAWPENPERPATPPSEEAPLFPGGDTPLEGGMAPLPKPPTNPPFDSSTTGIAGVIGGVRLPPEEED